MNSRRGAFVACTQAVTPPMSNTAQSVIVAGKPRSEAGRDAPIPR